MSDKLSRVEKAILKVEVNLPDPIRGAEELAKLAEIGRTSEDSNDRVIIFNWAAKKYLPLANRIGADPSIHAAYVKLIVDSAMGEPVNPNPIVGSPHPNFTRICVRLLMDQLWDSKYKEARIAAAQGYAKLCTFEGTSELAFHQTITALGAALKSEKSKIVLIEIMNAIDASYERLDSNQAQSLSASISQMYARMYLSTDENSKKQKGKLDELRARMTSLLELFHKGRQPAVETLSSSPGGVPRGRLNLEKQKP